MAKKPVYKIKSDELVELSPVTVGELKKQKGRSPLIIIALFALFIAFVIYLPDLIDYINVDEEKEVKRLIKKEVTNKKEVLTCKNNNFVFEYTFVNSEITKSKTNVTYQISTERYEDYLKKYKSYSERYSLVDKVSSSVNETEDGFTFVVDVTYPNEAIKELNNYALFNSEITREEIKTTMTEKNYTCK